MGLSVSPGISSGQRRIGAITLALCWLGGMIGGACVFRGSSLSPVMRSAAEGPVSIVQLHVLLPFLISAIAVSFSRPALFAVCFGKAFLFSFTALGIAQAFGDAGWLVCILVMFSDVVLLPLLYFMWLRLLSGRISVLGMAAIASLALLVVSVDYRIVSPFWASLINIQKG